MKGVDMRFYSKILKLSIILMLVLVLIPAVSAENSTETFFEEYDVADDEVYVEEYAFSDEYYEEDAQVDASEYHEIEIDHGNDNVEDVLYFINESVEMNGDDVNIIIAEEKSALDTQDMSLMITRVLL